MAIAVAPESLPLVLAGPIVRRATPEAVYLWLATSRPLVDADVLLTANGEELSTIFKEHTLRPGKNLFVTLFELSADEGELPTDTVIGYDIDETVRSGARRSIFDLNGLRAALALPGLDRPSFVLQGRHTPLEALYGSCRKLHGPGVDMMRGAAALLQDLPPGPKGRPHVLLLGGDQIYADDVSPDLIGYLARLGRTLIGRNETMHKDFPPGGVYPDRRGHFLEDESGLTSGEKDHHLLTIGEFAATYLLAWNPDVWPFVRPNTTEAAGKHGAEAARRVLANIPTYMIFDDHEVTDDWFLDARWRNDVWKKSLGRRVIAHGITAYLLFQGLGNQPRAYMDDGGKLEALQAIVEFCLSGKGEPDFHRTVWRLQGWSYVAPTRPPALVLNTRTMRRSPDLAHRVDALRIGVHSNHSRLFNDDEVRRLKRLLRDADVRRDGPLLVLAPTPVLGSEAAERMQEELQDLGPFLADAEAFALNPASVIDLFEVVAEHRPRPLVILSGDVHYGFEVAARAVLRGGRVIPTLQFCASAMKNCPEGTAASLLAKVNDHYDPPWYAFWETNTRPEQAPVGYRRTQGTIVVERLEAEPAGDDLELRIAHCFVLRSRGDGWTPLDAKNNMGQLRITGDVVRHRLFNFEGGAIVAPGFRDFDPAHWDRNVKETFPS